MPTTEQTLAAELTAIREELAELRRYVRTQPGYVNQGVRELSDRLHVLAFADVATPRFFDRLDANLRAGADAILACPAALEGYLAGADWELAVMIGRLERADATS